MSAKSGDKSTLLVVDDEKNIRRVFKDTYGEDYEILTSDCAADALEKLRDNGEVELVISDVKMPEQSGLELLEVLEDEYPEIPVILVTGYATVDMAVDAMKKGAFDFVVKPFDFDELEGQIERGLEVAELHHRLDLSYPELEFKNADEQIITASNKLQGIIEVVMKICDYKTNVLITGETGTGKELIAQAIHYSGKFKDKPFETINCAALPENLLESELFGHKKGAFTDAKFDKKGKVEVADGGTLFLDEISEISGKIQAKLLRLIQQGEIQPLGAETSKEVDLRVVAASNQDLEQAVESGNFRQDLYYRLKVVPIKLPPLRERKEEIIPLARYFLNRANEKFEQDKSFSPGALEKLRGYSWPGNIRELENSVERVSLLASGAEIEASDLDFIGGESELSSGREESEPEQDFKTLAEMEREHIKKALEVTEGDKGQASELLGIHRSTLYRKLKEADLD